MKGFPNQVSDLNKLADGLRIIETLNEERRNSKDDDILGEALVRGGVLGTGHVPVPVDQYLAAQRAKAGGPGYQSHRTGARQLREQYRLLGLIDDRGPRALLTEAGQRIASFSGHELDDQKREHWRRLIRNINHPGRDGVRSHPYQVLLRLVGKKPGITRAKCALALEARDDSEAELDRIAVLSDLNETEICLRIRETKRNWDNAKKILPRFAEQLGDVIKFEHSFYLAAGPGQGGTTEEVPVLEDELQRTRPSRPVTPDSIALAATSEDFDEVDIPVASPDPEAIASAVRARRDRLHRHNVLVREVARRYDGAGLALFEGRYDCFASGEVVGILNEVKTLDGTRPDESTQVRDALGQLLYYEPFVKRENGGGIILKVAVFESRISDEHIQILQDLGIVCIWKDGDRFAGGPGADDLLGPYFEELR